MVVRRVPIVNRRMVMDDRHMVIIIKNHAIEFLHMFDGGGSGSEPYGAGCKHFTVQAAWRAIEKICLQRNVETTQVLDAREEAAACVE